MSGVVRPAGADEQIEVAIRDLVHDIAVATGVTWPCIRPRKCPRVPASLPNRIYVGMIGADSQPGMARCLRGLDQDGFAIGSFRKQRDDRGGQVCARRARCAGPDQCAWIGSNAARGE